MISHHDTRIDENPHLEQTDRRLLALIQQDATLTAQALGETQPLRQPGRAAAAAAGGGGHRARHPRHARPAARGPRRAGLHPGRHGHPYRGQRPRLRRAHAAQPEIVGAWTLTGEADYLLRVYCTDLDALNRLVQGVLLPHPAVSRVQSQIVMDRIKPDAPLPL
jgi:hypothetical protein